MSRLSKCEVPDAEEKESVGLPPSAPLTIFADPAASVSANE
jgi:hypothetical protein